MPRPAPSRAARLAVPSSSGRAALLAHLPADASSCPTTGPSLVAWDSTRTSCRSSSSDGELLAGRLPLWNRFEFAGIPFLATAQPRRSISEAARFATLHGEPALVAFLAVHHLLAASACSLLRRVGIGPLGALTGAAYAALAAPLLLSMYHRPLREPRVDATPVRGGECVGRGGGAGPSSASRSRRECSSRPATPRSRSTASSSSACTRSRGSPRGLEGARAHAVPALAAGVVLGSSRRRQTFPWRRWSSSGARDARRECHRPLHAARDDARALATTAVWSFPRSPVSASAPSAARDAARRP
jgi:hypothetical protein